MNKSTLGVDEQTSTSITGSVVPTALDQARKKQSLPAVLVDTLGVTKLDGLARSLPDARDIADELTMKGVPQLRSTEPGGALTG